MLMVLPCEHHPKKKRTYTCKNCGWYIQGTNKTKFGIFNEIMIHDNKPVFAN